LELGWWRGEKLRKKMKERIKGSFVFRSHLITVKMSMHGDAAAASSL
jgi:hypothetical protein